MITSQKNGATAIAGFMESVKTQGIDFLVEMTSVLMEMGRKVRMSKRDIKRVFRNCPLDLSFKEFMAIVFLYKG